MLRAAMVMGLMLVTAPAFAQERRLGQSGSPLVLVFKDRAALNEAVRLIKAGVHKTNPPLVNRLTACIAVPGDKAVVIEEGFSSALVVVTSGEATGCRGAVINQSLLD